MRNIKLAHKLWDDGELYEFVPEDTYEAIAEILRWIASFTATENANMNMLTMIIGEIDKMETD